jgi:proline dehydrogenase
MFNIITRKPSSSFSTTTKQIIRSYSSSSSVDFNDTKTVYSKLSTSELFTSHVALSSCRNPIVRRFGPNMLLYGGPIARIAAKYTYFKYFCGGESLQEIEPVVAKNYARGLQTILDYCVEGAPLGDDVPLGVSEQREDDIAHVKYNSITVSAQLNHKYTSNDNLIPCPLGVVKMTGISDCNLLLRLSEILTYIQLFPNSKHSQQFFETQFNVFNKDYVELMKVYARTSKRTPAFLFDEANPPKALNEKQLEKWKRVIDRLERICAECKQTGVGLLIDAEQTYLQPAIDLVTIYTSLKYNTNVASGERPTVHNTYQLYLKDTYDRLVFDHNFIINNSNAKQSVKLVRGAYIASESQRVSDLKIPYPFNESKQATDANYHRGVDFALNTIAKKDNMAAVVASHNPDSVVYAAQLIEGNGLSKRDKRVMFAQLYGMGDSLSLTLANAGYNIGKLVPFGPVDEVLPYLSRRVTENSDFLGGAVIETNRLRMELARRRSNK